MRDNRTNQPSAIAELALWGLAGLFLTALALMAVTTAKYLVGWTESQWIAASVAVGAMSLTWGSWASLVWTRSRVLKTLMVAVVVIPAAAMMLVGGWAFLNVPENRWIWKWGWLIVAGHGLGALAATLYICGRGLVSKAGEDRQVRARQLVLGWLVFPLIVVGASTGVVAAMLALMPEMVAGGGDGVIETLTRWIVPSQAVILITTLLPAGAASLCERLARTPG